MLPANPQWAFDLLVTVFEADGVATKNCGDHRWEVEWAFERAAGMIAEAEKSLPAAEVKEKITASMAVDSYGARKVLSRVLRTMRRKVVHADGTARNQTDPEYPPQPACMRVSFPLYGIDESVEQYVERVTK